MSHRNDLPAGWRQPPETTAEPVPLRRPYAPAGEVFPAPHLLPPQAQLVPQPPAAPGQPPADTAPPPAPRQQPALRRWRPMRAIIGDGFRVPMLWCEFGDCIARYISEDALGERDLRDRALATGWRYDALGRLGCPSCVRHDPSFR